ncbi:type VI secretion system tube protein TssD [Capnocytophaga canimorsus]|uniref:type VI secretion system tube protein TssD n=1 Tax=Capnocytophaga canimorsus TaxID=28188 RepID=UPI00385FC77E
MKSVLNVKGIERTLISFRLPHRRRIDTSGYPCSLPRDSFFYVSFLAEEGDDFFMQWMCGKNIAHGGAKGFWHDGEIVFYDETSDGQEFYRYDLQYVMPIHFRLEYDHQNGMVIHLTLTALDRVYNHLLHTENFYGYFFEYAKPKEKPKPMPKEEPVVYVRDLEADKPEAQPNEKVTYKVTKYSQEKVTENDKKRIQWAIKIDDKQEVLKEKGEKLELTIKEEWAGKKIIVMPFLVKPYEEKVSKKTRVKEKLIDVTTKDGKYLFSLKPNEKHKAQTIIVKEFYEKGIQWFCPFANNYLKLVDKSPKLSTFSELKHFTWNKIAEFAEKSRWSTSYRGGGSGDWKTVKEGGSGYYMVTIEGFPYWADAIGQIPFSVDMMTDYLEEGLSIDASIRKTIELGIKYGNGKPINPEEDKTNSYDNHMILKACLWTSKRFIQKSYSHTILGKEYKKSYELLKTDYSPKELGVFLTEVEYNKYKHLWQGK